MLDKPTAFTAKPLSLNKKIDRLFALDKIEPKDIEELNYRERQHFMATATKRLDQLTGFERDNFLEKIDAVLSTGTKNHVWEHNHHRITTAVTNCMRQNGVMPAKSDIAEHTGLSRTTVDKHLKDYKSHPGHIAEIEQFKFMAPRLLSNVFKFAVNGDMKASRLYFEMVGALNKQQTNMVVNKQNNYIQINNTILSQENLKNLTAKQLNQIESIITNSEC